VKEKKKLGNIAAQPGESGDLKGKEGETASNGQPRVTVDIDPSTSKRLTSLEGGRESP